MSDADEDLIESDKPSPTASKLGQRLDLLLPARVGRRFLAIATAAALAIGLSAGYLLGADPREVASQSNAAAVAPQDVHNVPFVSDGVQTEDEVVVHSLNVTVLTLGDLTALGEHPLSSGYEISSGLAGMCVADPPGTSTAPDPAIENGAAGVITFDLGDALLSELITADLDILAASTLRGKVELAQACRTDAVAVETDGVVTGIGDEYAVFTVRRTDPGSASISTGYVILVRLGGQLIEVSVIPNGPTEVPDGLNRALRIADAAVSRMLSG